jgi:predicted phosphoribosyltransferase/dienelactone hydrolase
MVDTITRRFLDRHQAGQELGARVAQLHQANPVVLGLARGGMPVAQEVARALAAPLDVLVVRKIGAPGNPEYGIGALAEGDVLVLDERAVRELYVSHEELEGAVAHAQAEIAARIARYRGARAPLAVEGRTAIVVDDGLATGGTARAALRAVRARGPRRLLLAVPVGAPQTVAALSTEADQVVCLLAPRSLWAVGAWYEDFSQTPDAEIVEILAGASADPPPRRRSAHEVQIPVEYGAQIAGDLELLERPRGLVVFAHGSGSSRHSPRNRQVAADLHERGLATLLLDLLTAEEEGDRAKVFDIPLLAGRLVAATLWARGNAATAGLPIGYFGASTGAGAALWAAADLPGGLRAVVSRGGRPDLAAPRLAGVRAPVLLIVGGRDDVVLELNRQAQRAIEAPCQLSIVAGATHLFEEPGALEQVGALAADWLEGHLAGGAVGAT